MYMGKVLQELFWAYFFGHLYRSNGVALPYHSKFRHIQAHSYSFQTFSHIVAYSEHFITLEFSEPCNIQNTGTFRTQDIFRTLSGHILGYSECCVRLTYGEPCHIQNFAILRIDCISRIWGIFKNLVIQEYLGILQ